MGSKGEQPTHNSVTSSSTISKVYKVSSISVFSWDVILTNVIVESKQCSREFAFALHDHPDLRAYAPVNKFFCPVNAVFA